MKCIIGGNNSHLKINNSKSNNNNNNKMKITNYNNNKMKITNSSNNNRVYHLLNRNIVTKMIRIIGIGEKDSYNY